MPFLKLLGLWLMLVPAVTAAPASETVSLAPGYGKLGYEAPEAGSYRLPPLQNAADGEVVKASGETARLHDLYGDKLVLLSFIYSTCNDVNGCPLATAVLARIKSRLDKQPEVAAQLRLISLSFDPEHDTPEVMRLYGNNFARGALEWTFLTTDSEQTLAPVLEAYGQSVMPEYDEQGEITGGLSHILRVVLIDRDKRIRNIYSVSFLHPDLLINDVKTLLLEEQGVAVAAGDNGPDTKDDGITPTRAGDFKAGYETGDYRTRSVSVVNRRGKRADLMQVLKAPPLGLPPVPVSADNPVTGEKVELGRKLFFDRRLSLNNTISCAICHIPEQGFTSNEMALAVGIEGRTVRRNAPTVYNSAYMKRLFHDGREYRLEHQVWAPLLAKNEMGNPSIAAVINKIRGIAEYDGLFEAAFDGKGPGMETIGQALASYERTLVSANSPFDRWHFGGQEDAIGESAKRGFALFTGKAGCVACHHIGESHALFTDHDLHNTGLGWYRTMGPPERPEKVLIAPGIYLEVDQELVESVGDGQLSDIGLYEVTQNPADRWRYRTPGLRNIALTAPYMHDGSMESLTEVVEFYNGGGFANEGLDPRIRPLGLSPGEIQDLVDFMATLTGDNVGTLVADAFAAPVGDLRKQDPDWTHDNKGNF